MKTGVIAPFAMCQSEKPITSGSALATPGNRLIGALLARVEERGILEALGAVAHDPEIGVGMVDHPRDHLAEAEIEAHLHHHQHDGKDDADHGRDEAQPVMKQIARGEREIQRHASLLVRIRSRTAQRDAVQSAVWPRTPSVPAKSRLMAALAGQLSAKVPAKTRKAFSGAPRSAGSSAYCSQTTKT